MSEKKKINWLLILQGWAMLWVVIGHAYVGNYDNGPMLETMLRRFAYSFHMPLFMLVSGWLFYLTRLKADWGGRNRLAVRGSWTSQAAKPCERLARMGYRLTVIGYRKGGRIGR